jgi:FkbM family methyltransferase
VTAESSVRAEPAGDPPHFDPAASEADIMACFRLLLGRAPNPEEWPGHSARAGENLATLVASYLNTIEFERRGLLRHDVPADVSVIERAGVRLYVTELDGWFAQSAEYEPEVTAVFREHLAPGMGVIDLGANVGYFALLAASLVGPSGYVLAMEPNPRNIRLLEASRRLNGFAHLVPCQAAAGKTTGLLALHAAGSNGTTSPPADDPARLLAAETVAAVRPDALVPAGRRIDFIKADVEGAEFLALSGCDTIIARDRPVIVSEFSPGLMPGISGIEGTDYLRWLTGLGYATAVLRADGPPVPAETPDAVMALYAAHGTDHVDLLLTPRGAAAPPPRAGIGGLLRALARPR